MKRGDVKGLGLIALLPICCLGLPLLGSPTVRVGGIDVDPNTEERSDYALSCRVFRTEAGIAGQPDERWVRETLRRETEMVA